MQQYPKQILSISQQLQTYIDAGMHITSREDAISALTTIGYYRLRGYCFHLYSNDTKEFAVGTDFSDILKLYQFDTELSRILFSFASKIEVSLRVNLTEALLIHQDALSLHNAQYFSDKKLFWKNNSALSSEIARSGDVFIKHNYNNHDGLIPVWAAVEVMSFGTLSKIISNLKTGKGSAASALLCHYKYPSSKNHLVTPSLQMFSSWTQAVSILRNMCAHNSRIYNRTISTHAQIPSISQLPLPSPHNGLFQIILVMKYLRPSNDDWNHFILELTNLLHQYETVVELNRINFPVNWIDYLKV